MHHYDAPAVELSEFTRILTDTATTIFTDKEPVHKKYLFKDAELAE